MKRLLFYTLLVFFAAVPPRVGADEAAPLTRIAFGSCAQQERPLPIFKAIVGIKPELFLSLGDNIYADTEDMAVMKRKYDKLMAIPEYQQLRKMCLHMAIWDDHDFGKNDGGAEYPKKDEAQQLFLDFFNVPPDSPRRKMKGVYNSATFGPAGKRLQVIMMDGRYFRSPLKLGEREPGLSSRPYVADTDPQATFLGEDQWKWLAEQLKQPAEIRLLVSGIQVIAEDHGFEKWMNFPLQRERLFKLLKESKAGGVIILSGDRHLAELSLMEKVLDYPLYDLTSSGLNQASKTWRPLEKNRHRVATMTYGDNFGMIGVDWSAAIPKISLQIRDVDGDITIQQKLLLSDLQPAANEQPAPTKGAISAEQASKKIDEEVVVEMRVMSTGGSVERRLFLNSKKNYRDEGNFTIVVNAKAFTGPLEKANGATFLNKIVRINGKVIAYKKAPEIVVDDPKQLEIVVEKNEKK